MIRRDSFLDKALNHRLFNSPRQTLAGQDQNKKFEVNKETDQQALQSAEGRIQKFMMNFIWKRTRGW